MSENLFFTINLSTERNANFFPLAIMSDLCPPNAWMHFLYFGNFHTEKKNWSGFPVRCFVVYNIDNKRGEFWERKRNDGELGLEIKIPKQRAQHAEIYAIQNLTNIIQKQKEECCAVTKRLPITIDLYINTTPCQNCAKELVKFKTFWKNQGCEITLKVVFSSFYNIQRYSCGKCSHKKADDVDHINNCEGIKLMCSNNIQLSPFGQDDWKMFQDKLQIETRDLNTWTAGINKRRQEDINLKEDLEHLCSS